MLGPTQRSESDGLPTRVVAIGASAGGLEALQQVFAALPGDTGMAFVVVQHLSPDFKSLMPDLLSRQTRMPVVALDTDVPLRANTVYVLTPRCTAQLTGMLLRALPRREDGELNLPINVLFESLVTLGGRAAAVVLSGTGQDGLTGARTVKAAGGLVVAQAPSSARFDSMPRAIIDAGLADIIAMPGELGQVLVQWLEDPAAGRKLSSQASDDGDAVLAGPYRPVLNVLQRSYNLDFNQYKSGTLMRRIDRWLTGAGRAVSPSALTEQLESKPADVDRLFGDLMIGVTSFFRDPEAFEALRTKGVEPMIDALGERGQLRIWCCGCSTGQEAYSLALLAMEAFDRRGTAPRVRVLATDVHPASVQRASSGVYAEEALEGLPTELRKKYFTQLPTGHYRVTESLRRCVVFSVQNALRDAGFQHIDIVSCRNMLIYLRPAAQSQVLASFHTALNAEGLMFLGKSEQPSEHSEAFSAVDEGAHLYRKRAGLELRAQSRPQIGLPSSPRPALGMRLDNRASFRLQEVLAQRYVPSGFLVNASDELVYVFGTAGQYLKAAPGRFGGTMFNLLTGELRTAVMMSLRKAAQNMTSTSVTDVRVDDSEPNVKVRIDVDPIADRTLPHHYFMVRVTSVVRDVQEPAVPAVPVDRAHTEHILELETELIRTREALQRCIEDLESSNEELQAGNEELMAANEELQSSNEELFSVNSEHELKIRELRDTTADLNNLIRATEFAIIFLDLEGRLRLYTPPATQLFPLRPEDLGRELAELLPRESDPGLFEDIADAMLGGGPKDHELRLRDGRIMRRRVTSYQNDIGAASGFVITYVEVTQHVQLREQKLALQHRAELSTLVESVPNLMWACSVDGPCTYLSPQWVRYTGIPAEPQLGEGWLQQVHPDDRDPLMAAWTRSVRNADAMRVRIRLRRHDGEYRWFENHAVPQIDANGKVEKWFGSSTDVHEVTLLQERLLERDRFMQMIADSVNGMIGYWDRDQRNQFANRHYSEWFGMTAEEVRGKTLREVLGDPVYALNRSFAEAALRGEAQQFERTITRADGTTGYVLAEYRPHLVDGMVRGFTATATDITRVQEARLLSDHIFTVNPVPTMIVAADGRLLRWNNAARELLGYDEEQMAALHLEQLIPAHLRERHQRFQVAYMANPTHRAMGNGKFFPLVRADGSEVDVEIDLGGITVAGHRAVLVCVRKVAELSTVAQRQLDHTLRARSAFLAQMSHEIRTPLNAILGMAQLLELENPTAKQLDRLRRIEDASRLLLDIINDVLDISSLEAGGLALNKEQFSLQQLMDRSLGLISERLKLKQLQLRVDVHPGVPDQLVGDGRRIEQVLVNLLTNAVKFTNLGTITVEVSCTFASDKRVVLRMEVRDTGIGIAPQDLAALFKPFRQLKQGHARTYGGTGLGLSICRELARLMNGDCGVQSRLGVGSTFWFTAQVERASAAVLGASLPSITTAVEPQQFPNKRALVVEDNEINREVICELLQSRFGLQVRAVADGHEALRVVEEEPFDIVLMDIQMPGLDGLETTRLMRSRSSLQHMPIYALSANVAANDVNECIASGMNGHLGKPLLVESINEVLCGLWGRVSAAQ